MEVVLEEVKLAGEGEDEPPEVGGDVPVPVPVTVPFLFVLGKSRRILVERAELESKAELSPTSLKLTLLSSTLDRMSASPTFEPIR